MCVQGPEAEGKWMGPDWNAQREGGGERETGAVQDSERSPCKAWEPCGEFGCDPKVPRTLGRGVRWGGQKKS
jgi:hypothetical protein